MTALTLDPNVVPAGRGWRVRRSDGSFRMVLPRLGTEPNRYAVFDGDSTEALRNPPLGYSGSWGGLDHAIAWAREAT